MKEIESYLKELRILLLFFPLLRMFFRNLRMLCMLFYAKRMQKRTNKIMRRFFRLHEKNLGDPYMPELFPHYRELFVKTGENISPDATIDSLRNKLLELMEAKQLYKHLDLTVDDISSELATNRTYLSKLIKHSFRTGFRDFVNKTRLEKAQEIMSRTNSENLNLLAVSEQVGFRNYGTFNSAFKKEYGMTPGEWKRRETQQPK